MTQINPDETYITGDVEDLTAEDMVHELEAIEEMDNPEEAYVGGASVEEAEERLREALRDEAVELNRIVGEINRLLKRRESETVDEPAEETLSKIERVIKGN